MTQATPPNPDPKPENTPPSNPPNPTPPANNPPSQSANTAALEKLIGDFSTQLSALPETLAKSIKEAVGTPKQPEPKNDPPKNDPPANDPPKNDPPKNEPKNPTGTPGKKSFADWWFGS